MLVHRYIRRTRCQTSCIGDWIREVRGRLGPTRAVQKHLQLTKVIVHSSYQCYPVEIQTQNNKSVAVCGKMVAV
jgi:hypothetical protein